MKTSYLFWLLVILVLTSSVYSEEDEDEDKFIPTKEWQEVKPGQAIPPGLHVKMDLQKGGKWAKLMDGVDEQSSSLTKSVMISEDQNEKEKNPPHLVDRHEYKIKELKSALKKIKQEKIANEEDHDKEVKENFRSMDEIKSAFEELNLNKESDFEAMTRLLSKYKNPDSTSEDKLLALQDLEYYVHQVDNANDFVKLEGLTTVLQGLNSTDSRLRQEAAHVIGSAVQSNPAVQVKVVELGGLSALVRLLADTKQPAEARKKALYAVSSLIRNFPAAQYFFSNSGGFSALMNLFRESGVEKLQMKAISLINDLVVERRDLHLDTEKEQNEEKIRQYNLFSLSSTIEQMGLCQDIADMLNTDSHDHREKLLTAAKNLHGVCGQRRQYVSKVSHNLVLFQREYKKLLKEEEKEGDSDSFFHHMHDAVSELITLLKEDDLRLQRSEL